MKGIRVHCCMVQVHIQWVRQRLSHSKVIWCMRLLISIIKLVFISWPVLLDWGLECFSKREGQHESKHNVCAVSFYLAAHNTLSFAALQNKSLAFCVKSVFPSHLMYTLQLKRKSDSFLGYCTQEFQSVIHC